MLNTNAGLVYEILWSLKCASSYNGKSDTDFKLYASRAKNLMTYYKQYCNPAVKSRLQNVIDDLRQVWCAPVSNDAKAVDTVLGQVWYKFEGIIGAERKL